MKLASFGFLADLGTVSLEIAQFANGMAADSLLENIRRIADGSAHVVTAADEVFAELHTLGVLGYKLVMGGAGTCSDTDLIGAFAKGRDGKLF